MLSTMSFAVNSAILARPAKRRQATARLVVTLAAIVPAAVARVVIADSN